MRRRSVLQPLTGEPPTEIKLFSMGPNPATDGIPAIVDPEDVAKIMETFQRLGRPIAGKVEHNRGDTSCRGPIVAREDGIYVVDVVWTPAGLERWAGHQSTYVSPEFDADKRGHVSAIWGFGLTDDPASFNPVSVHQRSIQGMPLLSDALMAVAPEGACSCEVTVDGRVVYYLETDDYEERVVVMDYSIVDGAAVLEGRPVETEIAVIVVEPAEDARPIPVITSFEISERVEPIEIERAVTPAVERAMIDDTPVLAKFPGASVSGLVLTMPDGSPANVDLQGNPLPPVAAPAPIPAPAPVVPAPVPAPMDPAVMRALVNEEIQRSIAALKPAVVESIVQPERLTQPPSVRTITVSGPVDRCMRR